jgi:YbbR domain-containing protein
MATRSERFKPWLKGIFTRELPFKILSLVFALMIWAWVQTERIVSQRTRALVNWTWPEETTSVDSLPKTLVVTVKGPQGLVRTVKKRNLKYEVDLTDAEIGPLNIDFSSRALRGIPEGVQVVQISPPGVDLEVDHRMKRVVRIKPVVIGDPATGFKLDGIDIEPASALITGPRSLVRNIVDIPTDVVDLTDITTTKSFEIGLAPKHPTVTGTTETPLKLTARVSPIIVDKTFNEVPVMARADGWRTVPATAVVTLQGPAVTMKKLTADRLSVQAHLPSPVPIDQPLIVTFDPDADSPGLEVVHQGPAEVKVRRIQPDQIRLERAQ